MFRKAQASGRDRDSRQHPRKLPVVLGADCSLGAEQPGCRAGPRLWGAGSWGRQLRQAVPQPPGATDRWPRTHSQYLRSRALYKVGFTPLFTFF